MKIEAGKYYRDGFGEKIGPMERSPNPSVYCWIGKTPKGGTMSFAENGKWTTVYPSPYNLVAEWEDPGEGYRWVLPGEIVEETDEYKVAKKWFRTGDAGRKQLDIDVKRRRRIEEYSPPTVDLKTYELEQLRTGNAELLGRINFYKEVVAHYKHQLDEYQEANVELNERNNLLEGAWDGWKKCHAELTAERDGLADKVIELKRKVDELKDARESFILADESLRKQINELKQELIPKFKLYKTTYLYTLNEPTRSVNHRDIGTEVFVYNYPCSNGLLRIKLIDIQREHLFPFVVEGGHRFKYAGV